MLLERRPIQLDGGAKVGQAGGEGCALIWFQLTVPRVAESRQVGRYRIPNAPRHLWIDESQQIQQVPNDVPTMLEFHDACTPGELEAIDPQVVVSGQ